MIVSISSISHQAEAQRVVVEVVAVGVLSAVVGVAAVRAVAVVVGVVVASFAAMA